MKKFAILTLFLLSACQSPVPNPSNMQLSSPSFEHNQSIPTKFTCQGEDISPELHIKDIPEGTASLALTLYDPDSGSGNWTHWIMWNIPANTGVIPENAALNFATHGMNSWPKAGYGGPCPPKGNHRYVFTLYALKTNLTIPSSSNREQLEAAMKDQIIAQTELIGLYQKH